MTDYILKNGEKSEVRLYRARCAHLGGRLPDEQMAKTTCKHPEFTPVYKCDEKRFCTPFSSNVDVELIAACYGCPLYVKEPDNGKPS